MVAVGLSIRGILKKTTILKRGLLVTSGLVQTKQKLERRFSLKVKPLSLIPLMISSRTTRRRPNSVYAEKQALECVDCSE